MKTKFLFPHKFKKIGWILLAIAITFELATNIWGLIGFLTNVTVFSIYDSGIPLQDPSIGSPVLDFKKDDIHFELFLLLLVVGCIFIGFSRLKNEDEFTFNLRLESLIWSFYVMFILLLISIVFIYGIIFLSIQFYGLFAFLVLYILRFHFVLFKANKAVDYEK